MPTDPKKRAPRPPLIPLFFVIILFAGTFWVGNRSKSTDGKIQGAAPALEAPTSEEPTTDAPAPSKQAVPIAVTFDDLPGSPGMTASELRAMTEALLQELEKRSIPATGFVNSDKIADTDNRAERLDTLRLWLDDGRTLGNHGAGHLSLNDVPVETYLEDIKKCEPHLDEVSDGAWRRAQFFRHPYLQTGPDLESKRRAEAWLAENDYRIAPVTHENLDWMFSAVYNQHRRNGDQEGADRVAAAYLDFTDQLFAFWESVSEKLNGGPHPHVMLLHANQLNADHFAGVADVMERRGYRYVTLEEALEHPIYQRDDDWAGGAGVMWQFRWAKTEGLEIDWRQEPGPPAWIAEAYESR